MIRRLIILLLIVGCEEAGITTNGLTDGTAVTDTLYIFNYDTLIVTNYDTTIVYDTTFAIDTIYIETDNDEIFDVDWILLKNPNWHYNPSDMALNPVTDTAFVIIATDSLNSDNLPSSWPRSSSN